MSGLGIGGDGGPGLGGLLQIRLREWLGGSICQLLPQVSWNLGSRLCCSVMPGDPYSVHINLHPNLVYVHVPHSGKEDPYSSYLLIL